MAARPLSPEMALRVEKAFGIGMDMLLRMQAWHDAAQMRARAADIRVQRYHPGLTRPPYSRGTIRSAMRSACSTWS